MRIVAPSGSFDREAFLRGVALLEGAGFVLRYDEELFARELYLAGSGARRLAELCEALAEPDTKIIWVARGGYGAAHLLPGLEPEAIARAGKALVGFSDATALHAAWGRARVLSVHGANVTTLASWSEEARAELFALLRNPGPLTYQSSTPPGPAGLSVRGALRGGNLTVLASLVGGPNFPDLRGAILLIEDIGERPYRLDRALVQLVQAGALAGVRAIVVGQLSRCEDDGASPVEAITRAAAGLAVPLAFGFPFGHEPCARAVLLGGEAVLDVGQGTLEVTPPC